MCHGDSNDQRTVEKGLIKRLLGEGPIESVVADDLYKDGHRLTGEDAACQFMLTGFPTFVKRYVEANFKPIPIGADTSVESWLSRCNNYSENRKNELRRVYAKTQGHLSRKDYKVEAHVKTEGYPLFKHVRLINSRTDAFKVFAGPYTKLMEDVVYENPHFIKHVPVPERYLKVAQLEQQGRTYIESDYTSFEGSFRKMFMDNCECVLYRHLLQNYPEAAEAICKAATMTQQCSFRSLGVRFRCPGRRMSGDMWTSLGNGFSNLMIFAYLMHIRGCNVWDGYVEGDDGLFAVPCNEVPDENEYRKFGFNVKLQTYDRPGDASFCGMKYADQGAIRDPVEFVQGFGWTHSCLGARPRVLMSLLRAKALSAYYEMPTCPIITEIALAALRATRDVEPRFEEDGYHDHSRVPRDERNVKRTSISVATRGMFERCYGISVVVQVRIEELLGSDHISEAIALLPQGSDMMMALNNFTEYG